jgi:hypothetical protein
MKFAKTLSVGLGLAVALVILAPAAHAGVGNQATTLTFSRPVRIPNHQILPAGTYEFRVSNVMSRQNTVRIFNKNNRIVATLVTVPAYKTKVRGETQLELAFRGAHQAPVLLKWFYPGAHYGHAFLYSEKMEHQLRTEVAKNIVTQDNSNEG